MAIKTDVLGNVVSAVQSKIRGIAAVTKAEISERGYDLHIVAAGCGPGTLKKIEEKVAAAAEELRQSGDLEENLNVTVGTWY